MVNYTTVTNLRVRGSLDIGTASDVSNQLVTTTGATTARALDDRFADVVSVLDFGATGNGTTDDAGAFARALATGRPVLVPPPAVAYLTRSAISVPAGGVLKGIGNPLITYTGTASGIGIVQSAGAGCHIEGLVIDGGNQRSPITPWDTHGVKITHDDCRVIGVKVQNARIGGMGFFNVSKAQVIGCSANGSNGPGIRVSGVTYSTFRDNDVSLNLDNFGFYVEEGTAYCIFDGNRALNDGTDNVSLEMLGMTFPCHDNKVINNRAEGTGDNGISITGYNNIVMGNHCRKCRHAGIFIYGNRNTVVGNHCENNNQRRATDGASVFCGITVQPSWGGLGAHNTVVGNVCLDTQASPTQYAGVRVAVGTYLAWSAGETLTTTASYRSSGLNIYKPVTLGTTGATAPTHLSGDVSDGGVTWRYVSTADTNFHAKHNVVLGNTCSGNVLGDVWHDANMANTVVAEGDITIATPATPNLNLRILSKNASPAVAPGFAANQGSLFLRQGGGTGITAYLKSGANDTDWDAIQTRNSGTTAQRPSLGASGYDGYIYFDATLGKPVFRKAAIWVDATGATV